MTTFDAPVGKVGNAGNQHFLLFYNDYYLMKAKFSVLNNIKFVIWFKF